MKHRISLSSFFIVLFAITISTLSYGQTYPLSLTSFITPPYPTKFEDWDDLTNKVVLNIVNTSGNSYEANLNLKITGPNGFNVNKNTVLDINFEINAYKSINLKGSDWDNYGMNLEIKDILPASERAFIILKRAFREGNYNICWQVMDKDKTTPLSNKNEGCYSFEVVYGDTPKIIFPENNTIVSNQTPSLVRINWLHTTQGAPFNYSIKIVELPKISFVDVTQLMNNPGIAPIYEENGIKGFTKNLIGENFKVGYHYAIRVTAEDINNKVFFRNAGHSELVLFYYGTEINCPNFQNLKIAQHFPMDGDTIPFAKFPIQIDMEPACNSYFEGASTLYSKNTQLEQAHIIKWDKGLITSTKENYNKPNLPNEFTSKLTIGESNQNMEVGDKFTWGASLKIKNTVGEEITTSFTNKKCVYGMPVPSVIYPKANEQVKPGKIDFKWKSVFANKRIVPDYKVKTNDGTKKDGSQVVAMQDIDIPPIEQHYVIAIYKSSEDKAENIIDTKEGTIKLDVEKYLNKSTLKYNEEAIRQKLEEEITTEVYISNSEKYWYKIAWLNKKLNSPQWLNDQAVHATGLIPFEIIDESGDECENVSNYSVLPHFPMDGDTVPFAMFPIQLEMTMVCNSFKHGTSRLYSKDDQMEQTGIVKWEKGQIISTREKYSIPNLPKEFISKLVIGKSPENIEVGKEFTWGGNMTVRNSAGEIYTQSFQNKKCVLGMPVPRVIFPKANEAINGEKIEFKWKIKFSNKRIVPEYKIKTTGGYTKNSDKVIDMEEINIPPIEQHYVIAIYKSDEDKVENIIETKEGTIMLDVEKYLNKSTFKYNEEAIRQKLEEEITSEVYISNSGMYWYKIAWLKQKLNNRQFLNDYAFHSTGLIPFEILNGSGDDCEELSSYTVVPHFPMNGDTIPFKQFPIQVEMNPVCNSFKYGTARLLSKDDKIEQTGNVKWEKGQITSTREKYSAPTLPKEFISKQVIGESPENVEVGKEFTWGGSMTVQNSAGEVYSQHFMNKKCVLGMPVPRVIYPKANDTINGEKIEFKWKIKFSNKRIVPDYKVKTIGGHTQNADKIIDMKEINIPPIEQHYVIAIYKSNEDKVENIVETNEGTIKLDVEKYLNKTTFKYNEEAIRQKLEEEITSEVYISNAGKYWYKIAWLKNKLNSPQWLNDHAFHATGLIPFEVQALGDVCETLDDYKVIPHFPMDGDTIPFTKFPIQIEMSPVCNSYKYGTSRLFTKDEQQVRSNIIRWEKGLIISTREEYNAPNLSEEFISKLVVDESPKKIEPGKQFVWGSNLSIRNSSGDTKSKVFKNKKCVFGMPKPRVLNPKANEEVELGKIEFKWKTVFENKRIVPDYKLKTNFGYIQSGEYIKGDKEIDISSIDERWLLLIYDKVDAEIDKYIKLKKGKIEIEIDSFLNKTKRKYDNEGLKKELEKINTVELNLENKGKYWYRVVWVKDTTILNKKNHKLTKDDIYHGSNLVPFVVGDKKNSDDCIADSAPPKIDDKTATPNLKEGDKLKIGNFGMKVTTISKISGSIFSGTGEIVVEFLNNKKIKVEFKDIKKNIRGQIFSGTVKAIQDQDFLNKFIAYKNNKTKTKGISEEIKNISKNKIKLVSITSNNTAVNLPIGIDNEIEGNRFLVALTKMEFKSDKAVLQPLVSIGIPKLKIDSDSSNVLMLEGKDIGFGPKGLQGGNAKVFLSHDANYKLHYDPVYGDTELTFKGGDTMTYVTWNCKGIKTIAINIEYKFPRNIIVPDEDSKKRVVAKATLLSSHGLNFMGKVTMDDFQLPFKQLEGFGFSVSNAWIDLSNVNNPPNLKDNVPDDYESSTLNQTDTRKSNIWRGFWLEKVSMKLPKYIGNVDENRNTNISINNMLIDQTGFSANFLVENLIKWKDKKNIDGCAFSMDSLWVEVLQNNFKNAGLSGKIGAPFAKKDDTFIYRGLFDNKKVDGKSTPALVLNIKPKADTKISLPWMLAEFNIKPTSIIELKLSKSDSYIDFRLDATANINTDSIENENIKKYAMYMPGIKIENFGYHSTTGFYNTKNKNNKLNIEFVTAQASNQKFLSGFPVNLKKINLIGGGKNPSIKFQLALSLMSKKGNIKNGISADSEFLIKTKFDISKPFENIGIESVNLQSLEIDARFSGITLAGKVKFEDKQVPLDGRLVHKKGFFGEVKLILPANFGGEISAEFGTIKAHGAKTENTKDWYNYWRVYGKVKIGETGIPIFSGVQLYGMEGGVYHHMTLDYSTNKYTPDFTSILGLQFGVTFGSNDMGKAYVATPKISAEVHSGGSFKLNINGDIRIMNKNMNDTQNTKIRGVLDLTVGVNTPSPKKEDIEDRTDKNWVYCKIDVYLNFGIIKGGMGNNLMVNSTFYATFNQKDTTNIKKPQEGFWFFNMGKPEKRGILLVDFDLNEKTKNKTIKKNPEGKANKLNLKFTSYIMAGHNIPTYLPKPIPEFMNIYNYKGKNDTKDNTGGTLASIMSGVRKSDNSKLGKGFAFGSSFSANIEGYPFPFYFSAQAALGFDINLTQSDIKCGISKYSRGIDNWYATGQIYAAIKLAAGLGIDIFGKKLNFTIFEGALATIMAGGFPNPNWAAGDGRLSYSILNGLYDGSYHFQFKIGEPCEPAHIESDGAIAKIDFIQELKTDSEDNNIFSNCIAKFKIPINESIEVPLENNSVRKVRLKIYSWVLKEKSSSNIVKCKYFYPRGNKAIFETELSLKGKTKYTQTITISGQEFINGTWRNIKDDKGRLWSESKTTEFKTSKAPEVIKESNIAFTYPIQNQRSFLKKETTNDKGYVVVKNSLNFLWKPNQEYDAKFTVLETGNSIYKKLSQGEVDRVLSFDVSHLQNDKHYRIQITENKKLVLYEYYFKTSKYNTFKEKMDQSQWTGTKNPLSVTANTTISESLEKFDKIGYSYNGNSLEPLVRLTINFAYKDKEISDINYPDLPLNSYLKEKILPVRKTILATNRILDWSYIYDEETNVNFTVDKKIIQWSDNTSFSNPLSNDEINNLLNSNNILGGQNNSGISSPFLNLGGTNFNSSGSIGNLSFSNYVEIKDKMTTIGRFAFPIWKNKLAKVLNTRLLLFDTKGNPKGYNNYNNANYWVHKYLGHPTIDSYRLDKYWNKYKSKSNPDIKNYLYDFYQSTATWAELFTILSNQWIPPKWNSFIMQYQYPYQTSGKSSRGSRDGTYFRVSYYRN